MSAVLQKIAQLPRHSVYHSSRVEFSPRVKHSLVYSAKRARAIKHGGFGASHEKTTRIFNVRHVGTRLRTHARCGRHTAKNTRARLLIQRPGDTESRGRAKEQNERRFSRLLRALNKKSRREI